MAFNDESARQRLASLTMLPESIQTVSAWALFHHRRFERVVSLWKEVVIQKVNDADADGLLTLLYLANDVVQHAKRQYPEYVEAFKNAIESTSAAYRLAETQHVEKILRLLGIWRERDVFEAGWLNKLIENVARKKKSLAESSKTAALDAETQNVSATKVNTSSNPNSSFNYNDFVLNNPLVALLALLEREAVGDEHALADARPFLNETFSPEMSNLDDAAVSITCVRDRFKVACDRREQLSKLLQFAVSNQNALINEAVELTSKCDKLLKQLESYKLQQTGEKSMLQMPTTSKFISGAAATASVVDEAAAESDVSSAFSENGVRSPTKKAKIAEYNGVVSYLNQPKAPQAPTFDFDDSLDVDDSYIPQ